MIADLEDSIRANNLEALKDTYTLPSVRARKGITSGVFEGGGRKNS